MGRYVVVGTGGTGSGWGNGDGGSSRVGKIWVGGVKEGYLKGRLPEMGQW